LFGIVVLVMHVSLLLCTITTRYINEMFRASGVNLAKHPNVKIVTIDIRY